MTYEARRFTKLTYSKRKLLVTRQIDLDVDLYPYIVQYGNKRRIQQASNRCFTLQSTLFELCIRKLVDIFTRKYWYHIYYLRGMDDTDEEYDGLSRYLQPSLFPIDRSSNRRKVCQYCRDYSKALTMNHPFLTLAIPQSLKRELIKALYLQSIDHATDAYNWWHNFPRHSCILDNYLYFQDYPEIKTENCMVSIIDHEIIDHDTTNDNTINFTFHTLEYFRI